MKEAVGEEKGQKNRSGQCVGAGCLAHRTKWIGLFHGEWGFFRRFLIRREICKGKF